ncbi:MAG: hypothetical protein PW788_08080 [Micavibrio sp.]|nr:hypothetical protein [Micavibrio sp.]
MAYSYGKKKGFGEKLKGGLRRVFMIAAIGGAAVGAPAYYNYGTIHEQEVKLKDVKNDYDHWDSGKQEAVYNRKVITDKGLVLENENTKLHLKFNSPDIQDNLEAGKTYKIRYYGGRIDVPFIHTFPNLLSAVEVTPEELAERAKAQAAQKAAEQKAAGQQQPQQAQQQNQQQGNGQQQASAALSGTMITFETVAGGQKIEITAPIEAASKITINKVTPLVPQQKPNM